MRTKRFLALLLSLVMVLGVVPMTAMAYWEEPSAEGNIDLETTVYDYTKPVGVTMQRLKGNCVAEFGEDGNLGDDFLFVIKSGDRYYAMKDVPASETAYSSIPAVDVTDWVNADGSLTVPADTRGVAFMRYEERYDRELGMFINGREDYLSYSYSYESVDGDDDYYNDAERIYSGSFKIRTFEIGQYINNPGYWSENKVSGTLSFNGRWSYWINSYNSIDLKYELIVDLRDDVLGGKELYFRYLGTDVEYAGDEVEGYLYYSDCRHQGTVRHAEYDAPTCMLKGCEEYWYCENCNRYAKDKNFTEFFGEEMPVIPATGHDFEGEACKNCNRPVPVYSKVKNQADFDALADDTMFILVAEYNGKHYAMDFSEVYSYMTDADGDGFFDIHDIDDNSDGIPDYLEFDKGGGGEWFDEPNGIYDYLEWDMDNDGDVDDYDLHEFHIMVCDQHLTDMLYSNGGINATEISINPDGTISHEEAKKTAEFEMVGVYDDLEYDPDWHSHWENGEMPYHTKCVKQFAIPNYFLSAPSMRPIERMYQQRIYDFGDSSHWGVLFYDSRHEYFSYTDGDMNEKVDADEEGKPDPLPFPDISKEGSVAVFDTFDDIMWILYDEGQMAQLRLRDYNDTIEFVTGHDYELEGWEWVDDDTYEDGGYYDTHDTQACVYLYASAQYEAAHTCEFGDWYRVDGIMHQRDCDCGKSETEAHSFGSWSKLNNTYHQRECDKCDAIEKESHSFGEWGEYAGYEGITRHCSTDGCDAYETKRNDDGDQHVCEFGDWMQDPNNAMQHIRKCECGESESEDHRYDEWTMKNEHYHTHSCTTCGAIEDFEHNFNDWIVEDDNNHIHDCAECEYASILPHDYVIEITKEPTETEVGEATYTCPLCSHSYTEELPKRIIEITNENNGVSLTVPDTSNAYIPEGTVIDVVDIPTNKVPQQILGEIELASKGIAKPLAYYDLSLLLEGAEIQPNGTIQITLPALQQEFDADNVMVVYISPDGSYQECKTTVNEDGTITFETDHFSRYAVIEIQHSTPAIVWILISTISIVLIAGAVVGVIFIKKKKGIA